MKQLQSRIVVQCLITHVLLNHIDNDCDYHYYRMLHLQINWTREYYWVYFDELHYYMTAIDVKAIFYFYPINV